MPATSPEMARRPSGSSAESGLERPARARVLEGAGAKPHTKSKISISRSMPELSLQLLKTPPSGPNHNHIQHKTIQKRNITLTNTTKCVIFPPHSPVSTNYLPIMSGAGIFQLGLVMMRCFTEASRRSCFLGVSGLLRVPQPVALAMGRKVRAYDHV